MSEKALERVYTRLDVILTRVDKIDERLTERMDRIDGRMAESRDHLISRETEMKRTISALREGVEKDVKDIREDLDKLKDTAGAAKAAEGAAAGAARGVAEAQVAPLLVRQTLKQAARTPLGIFMAIAGAVTALASAGSVIPKIYRFFADVLPAIGYWLGGAA